MPLSDRHVDRIADRPETTFEGLSQPLRRRHQPFGLTRKLDAASLASKLSELLQMGETKEGGDVAERAGKDRGARVEEAAEGVGK